jgi:hypothetical protein
MQGGTVDVICTEVLEHNEFSEAKKIVRSVVDNVDCDRFIITVPNAAFNEHYGIDGYRHDDHKWEATADDLLNLVPDGKNTYLSIHSVGDMVNHIPVTYGLLLHKSEQKKTQDA